ncbi:MAG: Protein translocase subunit SecD, partial [Pseudomonadota bacterium]
MKRLILATSLAALPLAALTLLALPQAAAAQAVSSGPVVAAGNALLTVSAEGKSTRVPDLALFSAGVTTQAKTAGAALTQNAAQMNGVIAALKKAGIADRDIQTSNLSINPVYGNPHRLPDGTVDQEPVIIGYQATNQVQVKQRKIAAVDQSLEIVRRRIDQLGTREPSIQRQGQDRIVVQLPGVKDPDHIKSLLGKTAKLTFHLLDDTASVEDALRGRVPPGDMLLPGNEQGRGQPENYVVRKRVEVGGDMLTDAR